MSRNNAPTGRVGRPPVTSRTQILTAARRLIDQDGWEKLTIRRLAAEIGIGATTLYHHVRDKEDLLFLLIQEYAEQIPHPELPDEPRDRIVAATAAIHDSLAAWPWAAEVLTADGFVARLGHSALGLVETVVAGAVDHGCTPEQAVQVFRSVWYYSVGEILVRAHSARSRAEYARTADRAAAPAAVDTSGLPPHMAAVADQWATLSWQDTYRQGLEAFVDGLLAQAASATTQGRNG
ncbi:TetR/AcrR family transcriptional regulator [Streptomyces coelicoflavus]|uniref:TetR/AcrR family transcriptional regulator n=1 Tax=Streptomyces coelicoflavus TaxID=285562 RepID=UPI0036A79871